MPQPIQQSLIYVLLLWTTILSITQVVFVILLFTGGHHGHGFQNKSNEASGGPVQYRVANPTSPPCENTLLLRRMLTFKGTQVNNKMVKWKAPSVGSGLISEEGNELTIKKDGYFFLTLQVTLNCEQKRERLVSLMLDNGILLQGKMNNDTCSTGLLGKVHELSAGNKLMVTIDPPTDINTSEYLTHLDVIYMSKP